MKNNKLLFEKLTRWATNRVDEKKDSDPCWKNYKQVGMKTKNGKEVPNCVPKDSVDEAKEDDDPCWKDYEMVGMKTKNGKEVPNCVPKSSVKEASEPCCEACDKHLDEEDILELDIEEAPNKGKAVEKTVDGKKRSVGQAGKTPAPGTSKGDAYCARSAKIKKCKNPPCANDISRKRWKCRGSKSMKQE